MGDYTTLILSVGIKRIDDEKLEDFKNEILQKMPLCDSAYHATAPTISLNNWPHQTNISLITQAKYGRGIEELLDWLEPLVVDGVGPEEVWAIIYNEYVSTPVIRKRNSDGDCL